jgi:hypothetical protein
VNLRLPGGTSILDILTGSPETGGGVGGGAVVPRVTPDQLQEALASLRAGHVEFVILEDDPGFQQVAGDGNGPYVLERHAGDGSPPLIAAAPLSFEQVHRAMHAYLAGQLEHDGVQWVQDAPPPKRGLMRRLFGATQ